MDGKTFREDKWEREHGAGAGRSCVLQDGHVFEKAGVNVSVVKSVLLASAVAQMKSRGKELMGKESPFYAAGISLRSTPGTRWRPRCTSTTANSR
jgi:coproporphyrinogen III oxidase